MSGQKLKIVKKRIKKYKEISEKDPFEFICSLASKLGSKRDDLVSSINFIVDEEYHENEELFEIMKEAVDLAFREQKWRRLDKKLFQEIVEIVEELSNDEDVMKELILHYLYKEFAFEKMVVDQCRDIEKLETECRKLLKEDSKIDLKSTNMKSLFAKINSYSRKLDKAKRDLKDRMGNKRKQVTQFAIYLCPGGSKFKCTYGKAKKTFSKNVMVVGRLRGLLKAMKMVVDFQNLYAKYVRKLPNLMKNYVENPRGVVDLVEKTLNLGRECMTQLKQPIFGTPKYEELGKKCLASIKPKVKSVMNTMKKIGISEDEETMIENNPLLYVEHYKDQTYSKYGCKKVPCIRVCPFCLYTNSRSSDKCKHTYCDSDDCQRGFCQLCLRGNPGNPCDDLKWECGDNAFKSCTPNFVPSHMRQSDDPCVFPLQTPENAKYWYMGTKGKYGSNNKPIVSDSGDKRRLKEVIDGAKEFRKGLKSKGSLEKVHFEKNGGVDLFFEGTTNKRWLDEVDDSSWIMKEEEDDADAKFLQGTDMGFFDDKGGDNSDDDFLNAEETPCSKRRPPKTIFGREREFRRKKKKKKKKKSEDKEEEKRDTEDEMEDWLTSF